MRNVEARQPLPAISAPAKRLYRSFVEEDVVSTLISSTYMSGDCIPLKAKKKWQCLPLISGLSVLLLESNKPPWFPVST